MIINWIWLEVASIDEYKLAIDLYSENILYYAPWKTLSDLNFFVKKSNINHIIHIDSFSELYKLINILDKKKKIINIWVRINTDDFWDWQKYWINILELAKFIDKSKESEFIKFKWIHFHTSRNKNSDIYVKTFEKIGNYLSRIDKKYLENIDYIDFWGWFEKTDIEWTYFKSTNKWQLMNLLWKLSAKNTNDILILKSFSIDLYLKDIKDSLEKNIFPILWKKIKFFTEPWRIFVSDIMHILSKVVDVKDSLNNIVILDSWVNMIWWQRAEFEYFPVINLSSNGLILNQKALIYWNLCTTWDHWWYYCYTQDKLKENDLILLSNQWTLSYSLAQNFFINKIPQVYIL